MSSGPLGRAAALFSGGYGVMATDMLVPVLTSKDVVTF
jgi:hypothetical protein